MFPLLNALEIARLADGLARECTGAHFERLSIPERPDFPEGFLKNEWVLRLSQKKRDLALFLSVRPRACYVALAAGKGPKQAPQSTRSPFDQALSKYIKGARLTGIRAVDRERMLVLEFPGYWLIVVLIPALPEALLVDSKTLQILARSRTIREPTKQVTHWKWPDARELPAGLVVRDELVSGVFSYHEAIERALREDAFQMRLERAERAVADLRKALGKSIRQSEESIRAADIEPDWALYGETLKAWLYALPEAQDQFWQLGEVRVPTATGAGRQKESLEPRELLEKFFQLAKRKKRRREEARVRLESAQARLAQIAKKVEVSPGDWGALVRLEQLAGIALRRAEGGKSDADSVGGPKLKASVPAAWQGKVFVSKDGFPVLVGRSREENLELTFKIARGNDLWMHVRGKPGAHVLIPVPSGKSVPLETLLDAAALCIFYSGGKDWGKTEVDYTFKKYVKRIKDSSEASYTNKKTIIASADPERMERLSR